MKKYFISCVVSTLIGASFAYLLISSYDKASAITISKGETVYYIQVGEYDNKSEMEKGMIDFESYIYSTLDNKFYTYIGISKNKENLSKIQGIYKEKGYDTYIREKELDNEKFIKVLEQYDTLLSKTDDNKTILIICNQVLERYEELVNNEH